MAVKIKSIKKIVGDTGLKCLVHGPAGAGKTVLSATTGEPTLIISAEAGLLSIKDAPTYIKGAAVESIQDVQELYEFVKDDVEEYLNGGDEPHFKWINLDSITEIAEQVLLYEKQQSKDPRKAYGSLFDHMIRLMKDFRDLPYYNVLFTCKQKAVEENGITKYVPLLPGAKLTQEISYLFDEVFALRVEKDEDGSIYRVLQTQRDAEYEAKDRSGVLADFEAPNMKKILKKIKGADNEEPEKPKAQKVEMEPEASKEAEVEAQTPVEEEGEPQKRRKPLNFDLETGDTPQDDVAPEDDETEAEVED